MKKFLMFSMVFVAISTTFISCHKSDMYDPDRPEEDARELYDRNFLSYVGGSINPNVDWGFGKARARTRAAEEPQVKLNSKGYSSEFSSKYFETVREYFPEDGECKSTDWRNYEFLENGNFFNVSIIYLNTTQDDVIGFYYYDPATETYENHTKVPLYSDIQTNGGNMGYYLRYNNYESGGVWNDVSTSSGYSIWTKSIPAKRIQIRTYTIYMNKTYRFGFYVTNNNTGKTYYSNMYLNADPTAYSGAAIGENAVGNIPQSYVVGLTDNDETGCNVLLEIPKIGDGGKYPLLVKPDKPEPAPLEWYRIIAEDLNAHDVDHDGDLNDTDFDFNDIVLDVALTNDGAKCILQAAGATLKIRINGNDNLEVHKMFGVEQSIMVNTHAEKKGLAHADKDPVEFDLVGSFSSIDKIKIEVYKQDRWMELTAPEGRPSCKIAVDTDFVWPDERESLKIKYPDFLNYVRNYQDIEDWWKKMNP
jgi:hypothetical protein